jgi:NAD(P)-dependent dehydrogenase (short-subunit alcohol dehydrogenase family)
VASVLGRLSIPMAGAYNASKHAVVALAETLRLEVGGTVPVILVEPGSIRTDFRENLGRAWGDLPERLEGTPYHAAVGAYRRRQEQFAEGCGMGAEDCAKRIFGAIAAERPPRRVVIGADSFWSQLGHRIAPAPLWEYALRRMFGLG